jgi:hypothetical protein
LEFDEIDKAKTLSICHHIRFSAVLPDSNFRLGWDTIMTFMVIYYAIAVPVQLSFGGKAGTAVDYIEIVFNCFFGLDIIINFCTGFKKNGVLVRNRVKIAKSYLKGWFWIDLVATVPVDLLVNALASSGSGGSGGSGGSSATLRMNKLFRMLRVFKLLRVVKIRRLFRRMEQYTKLNPSIVRLAKTMVALVFVWHWIACAYWAIAQLDRPETVMDELSADVGVDSSSAFHGSGGSRTSSSGGSSGGSGDGSSGGSSDGVLPEQWAQSQEWYDQLQAAEEAGWLQSTSFHFHYWRGVMSAVAAGLDPELAAGSVLATNAQQQQDHDREHDWIIESAAASANQARSWGAARTVVRAQCL